MGLDVGLEFGIRIDRDLIMETKIGCPECKIPLKKEFCAECGKRKRTYYIYKFICTKEIAEQILECPLEEEEYSEYITGCYDSEDGYRYITIGCDPDPENGRAYDMNFFKPDKEEQNKFIKETIENVKILFGIDIKPDDFGYFIHMSY